MTTAQREHEIVVLITSVAHRRASLASTLEGLAGQTVLPDRVLLRLDGYLPGTAPPIPPALLDITEVWYDSQRGAGHRWLHPGLAGMHPRSILHTLDDDLRPLPEYIERTTALVYKHDAAITWHGWPHEKDAERWAFYADAPEPYTNVATVGAGVSAYRWKDVEHLRHGRVPLAPVVLFGGPQCDDDALLSVHLWCSGVRIVRPGGRAPIVELPDSRGPGASFKKWAGYRHGQRLALAWLYNWPGLDHVLPLEVCELYRKQTPDSLVEEGFASVLCSEHVEGHRATEAVLRILTWIERTPSKQRPAFGAQLAPAIRDTVHVGPHSRRVLFVGLGRWSVWAGILLRALGDHVEHLSVSMAAFVALPACASSAGPGTRRYAADYRKALAIEDRYDLIVVAPHQHPEVVERAKKISEHVVELAEGMEQA